MFYCLEISVVILFVAVASVSTGDCPSNEKCSCELSKGQFSIFCRGDYSSIDITINNPGKRLEITCSKSKWSDFNLSNLTRQATQVEIVRFRNCDLPNNSSLKKITDMLGVTNIKNLIFRWSENAIFFKRLYLKGFKNLYYLNLSSNNISYVDQDLLVDLPELLMLNLVKNNLRNVTLLFKYAKKLKKLFLRNNMLQSIEPDTFNSLKTLIRLDLENNNLNILLPGIFDKLDELAYLTLTLNNLINLPEDIFGKLKNLEILHLDKNNFAFLPRYLLQNNKNLRIFTLNSNKKHLSQLPDKFFSNLTKLETLQLRNNGFTFLPENLLQGCFSLITLTLSENHLNHHNLPETIFRDLTNVTHLKIDFNKFEKLPHAISYLYNLQELDASNNNIFSITEATFITLKKLEKLNLANNHLQHQIPDTISLFPSLRIVNFSNNYLTLNSEKEKSPFAFCLLLEELYLANNHISKMFIDWNNDLSKLRKLDLKHNYISYLPAENLQFVSKNIEVDLRYNKIQYISLNAEDFLMRDDSRDGSDRAVILIDNNPFDCGCQIYDFLRYLENKINSSVKNYLSIMPGNLTCWNPSRLFLTPVTKLRSESLVCEINTSIFASMYSKKCVCFKKFEQNILIINCEHQNFTSMPNITRKPLDFKKIELNFSNNRFTQLPNLTELGSGRVSKLILPHNNISNITLNGLSKTIELLELHNNNISKISSDVLNFLRNAMNLTVLTLHRNPWICDCSTTDFFDFIHMKHKIIADLQYVTCHGNNIPISSMTVTDFCPEKQHGYIFILMFLLVGVIISIAGLLYYLYPHFITYIQLQLTTFNERLFTHRSLIEEDDEKLYDAFVSYSQDDHDFVTKELVHELENGPTPLKLCLSYRDWQANEWTTANIFKSVESSRRIIVVLSPSYLESLWGKTEFHIVFSQALCTNQSNVILLLYGDIGPTDKHFDPILKTYIDANAYVKWGDPWFWNKFRQLLEHDSQFKS